MSSLRPPVGVQRETSNRPRFYQRAAQRKQIKLLWYPIHALTFSSENNSCVLLQDGCVLTPLSHHSWLQLTSMCINGSLDHSIPFQKRKKEKNDVLAGRELMLLTETSLTMLRSRTWDQKIRTLKWSLLHTCHVTFIYHYERSKIPPLKATVSLRPTVC
jgi:hypothetical protein